MSGMSRGIDVEREDARHGTGEEVGRLDRQILERGEMAQREIHRSANGRTHREAGRLDRNRASSRHRIDERLRPRVPAREHDQLRRHRLAQRRRPHDHARAAAMPRSPADVDADNRTARFRRSRAAHNEHDVRGSASTSAATPRDASASTIAFLTTPRSWSGEASKSDEGPTSTEKRRRSPSGSLSSDESEGTRSAKSGSRRTAALEQRSHEMRDAVR